jgi:carboxymethylenebutenolidase
MADEPAIEIIEPRLRADDVEIAAYTAVPRNAGASTPGIVMVQFVWGIDAQLRDFVRRFASRGFNTIAPDLYARHPAPRIDGATDAAPMYAARNAMFENNRYFEDLLLAREWLQTRAPGGKTGIVGYCLGGAIALGAITGRQDYAAAAAFYGSVRPGEDGKTPAGPHSFDWTDQVDTPVIGLFGADDPTIQTDDVRAAFARIPAPKELHIYDGAGHGFCDDTRPKYYAAEAAADAFERAVAWLRCYL